MRILFPEYMQILQAMHRLNVLKEFISNFPPIEHPRLSHDMGTYGLKQTNCL